MKCISWILQLTNSELRFSKMAKNPFVLLANTLAHIHIEKSSNFLYRIVKRTHGFQTNFKPFLISSNAFSHLLTMFGIIHTFRCFLFNKFSYLFIGDIFPFIFPFFLLLPFLFSPIFILYHFHSSRKTLRTKYTTNWYGTSIRYTPIIIINNNNNMAQSYLEYTITLYNI